MRTLIDGARLWELTSRVDDLPWSCRKDAMIYLIDAFRRVVAHIDLGTRQKIRFNLFMSDKRHKIVLEALDQLSVPPSDVCPLYREYRLSFCDIERMI